MKHIFVICFSFFAVNLHAQLIPVPNPLLKPFYHGVASGDPMTDKVIIWTRITPDNLPSSSINVDWEVSNDLSFSSILQSGIFTTDSMRDFTVKVDVQGLQAGQTYYYRFKSPDGIYSLIGRTKTAPSGNIANLRFAVVSCSSIFSGYFNAYKRIAERGDLDAVIHLGDYIYDFVDQSEPIRVRPQDTMRNLVTLQDFRSMLAYYHLDPDLRAAHQQVPFIILWDNHDMSWKGSDSLSNPKYAGAIQAYYEWTPIRDQPDLKKMFRSFSYGNMAEIILSDVTHFRQKPFSPPGSNSNDDPNRKLWGDEQYAWLTDKLKNSTAKWKLFGSEKQFGQWDLLGMPGGTNSGISFAEIRGNADVNEYNADRVKFFKFLRDNSINNTIVISGDLHMSFAMDLCENPWNPQYYNQYTGDKAVAVEFEPTSITRVNVDEELPGLPAGFYSWLAQISTQLNVHHRYEDLVQHGYGILDLRDDKATGEFWYCDKYHVDSTQKMDAAWQLYDGVNHWNRTRVVTPTIPLLPSSPLAPFEMLPTTVHYHSSLNIKTDLYPNPAKENSTLTIQTKNDLPVTIKLIDIASGKILKDVFTGIISHEKEIPINVSDLSSQVVLIMIESGDAISVLPLVVSH